MSTNQTQELHLDWLLQQSASCYATEIDLMHKIRDRITFVSGVLIVPISGAVMSLISTYKWDDFSGYSWFFVLPIAVASILTCASLYYIFLVMMQKNLYKAQILPHDLFDYYLGGTNHDDAMYETKYHLIISLNDAIKNNFILNKSRLEKILDAQRAMTFSIPFLLVALPNYFYVVQTSKPETQNVKIENIEKFKNTEVTNVTITNLKELQESIMSNQSQSSGSQQATQTTTASSAPQPAQPTPSPEPLLRVPTRPSPQTQSFFDSASPDIKEGQQVLNEGGKG